MKKNYPVAISRIIIVVVWVLLFTLFRILSIMMFFWSEDLDTYINNKLSMIGYSGITNIMSVEVTPKGEVPNRPFVLVSNHLSYLDIPIYGSLLGAVFVSKSEIGSWPIIGFIAKIYRNTFVNRENITNIPQVNERLYKSYLSGDALVIFPEGTTSKKDTIREFKSSLLDFAAKNRIPVHYAYLNYQVKTESVNAEETVHWSGQRSIVEYIIGLFSFSKIHAKVKVGTQPILLDRRKELAKKLKEGITQMSESKGY